MKPISYGEPDLYEINCAVNTVDVCICGFFLFDCCIRAVQSEDPALTCCMLQLDLPEIPIVVDRVKGLVNTQLLCVRCSNYR